MGEFVLYLDEGKNKTNHQLVVSLAGKPPLLLYSIQRYYLGKSGSGRDICQETKIPESTPSGRVVQGNQKSPRFVSLIQKAAVLCS